MKSLLKIFFVCALILGAASIALAQNTKKEKKAAKVAAVKKMVNDVNYVFKANYANPEKGQQRMLSYDYDLKVSKDTVKAFLPYFGQAYVAPNPSELTDGGINFTSTNFKYSTTQRKNGSWDIFIKPKDNNISNWRDVQQMRLNISPDGYASLQVISSNRDPISFYGSVVAKD